MEEERLVITSVPTRLYIPENAGALLLLGHGGAHSKDADRFVHLSRYYAERTGLAVVCIDAVDHGDRRPPAATEGLPRGWHSRTVPQMVADWTAVAGHLSSIGPPVAYVGFSMGALFGFPIVASMSSIGAAAFVVGGIPDSRWSDDPGLARILTNAASRLDKAHVLMLNKEDDESFAVDGVRVLFDSVVAKSKQLLFWPGSHDDWGPDLLARSASFLTQHGTEGLAHRSR